MEAEDNVQTGPLAAEDARALSRLVQRVFGRGFRLVVIEVAARRLQQRIIEWLRVEVAPFDGQVLELDVGSLPGQNLWSELGDRVDHVGHGEGERSRVVLALHGFQEAAGGQPDERAGLYRQLNVQRDLFVRDLGCFWVLLIHPQGSRQLQDIAPDFCDFTSLWIRAPERAGEVGLRRDAARVVTAGAARSLGVDLDEPQPALLSEAGAAIEAGEYTQARDLLTRFDLATGGASEDEGRALRLRANLERLRGNLDAAQSVGERALAWSLARGDRGKAETAAALHVLAGVLEAQGQYERARTSLERSLEIQQELHGTQEHPAVAASLHELGRVQMALGDIAEARRLFERALKLHEDPRAVAATLHELATIFTAQDDHDAARQALEETLELETMALGAEHPIVSTTHHSLGVVLHAQGDFEAARQHVERSLAINAKVFGTELHPNVAASLHELGAILREQGDLDGAREMLERALEIDTRVFATQSHPAVAATLHELARVQWEQGDLDGARQKLERALEIVIEVFGTQLHPSAATILHALAMLLEDRGEFDESAATFERALDIATRVHGPDHHSACTTEVAFAQILLEKGERERAQSLLRHARPILASVLGPANPWVQRADALLDRT